MTIRVDADTHERLRRVATAEGSSVSEVVRVAAAAAEQALWDRQMAAGYERLHADPSAWAAYTADIDAYPLDEGITG